MALRTNIVLDLIGNLPRQARRFGRAMSNFTRRSSRQMQILRRSAAVAGRGLDRFGNRYTALIGAAVVGRSTKFVVDLERRFTRLGIQSNKTAEDMNKLKKEIFATASAPDIRIDPGQLTGAVEKIVEKTGDLDLARRNMRNIALVIQATGASGRDVGAMIADMQEKFGIKNKDKFLKVLDTLVKQGKAGAFTLQNMATQGERVTAAYAATGRVGPTAVKEMGAILQVIRRGVGSAEEASTAFERLLGTLTRDKVGELRKRGIQIWDAKELAKGNKVARSVPDIIKEIIRKTKGDPEKLAEVFDIRAMRALTPFAIEFKQTGGFESFDKFLKTQGTGAELIKDSGRAANDAAGAMRNLYTAWQKFSDSELTGPIQGAAKFLNKLGDKKTGKAIRFVTYSVLGLLAAGAALKVFSGVRNIFGSILGRGGRGGGIGGGMPIPLPVTIVGRGMGGALGGRGGKRGRLGRVGGRIGGFLKGPGGALLGKAGLVALAGAIGYGLGTLINQQITKALTSLTGKDNTLGTFLHEKFGSVKKQTAAERKAQVEKSLAAVRANRAARLDIKVDSEGRVKTKLTTGNGGPDINVDTGIIPAGT